MLLVALALAALAADDPQDANAKPKLTMTPAVACAKVNGYEDYVPLAEVVLTKDDKLLLYYEPSGFEFERVGREYRVHLVQDGRVRRKGEKKVLQSKDKLLDYKGTFETPSASVYLANTVALKPLPPGEYELEIILHDEVGKGPPARQFLKFRVKASEAEKTKPAAEKPKASPDAKPRRT